MKIVETFAGIGGTALGIERADDRFETVGFVEFDEKARRVLSRRWGGVPMLPDVRTFRGDEFGSFDLLVSGFPCQDVSLCGSGEGIEGERSSLYRQTLRVARSESPPIVVLENVVGLVTRGLDIVVQDFRRLGYRAEVARVSARGVGLPQWRPRVFIVLHDDARLEGVAEEIEVAQDQKKRGDEWNTVRVSSAYGVSRNEIAAGNPKSRLECQIAIKSGQTRGIPVPEFAEFISGFPIGFTDLDVLRPEERSVDPALMIREPKSIARIRQIGNAVCPPCSELVASKIAARVMPPKKAKEGNR